MIIVYCIDISRVVGIKLLPFILRYLSEEEKQKVQRFRDSKDLERSVLGKALLLLAFNISGGDRSALQSLSYNANKKPYIEGFPFFNISHSHDLVVCGTSGEGEIGIDVEKIIPCQLEDFKFCYVENEWTDIQSDQNSYRTFYKYWTRKEAILKGDGRGLQVQLDSFNTINDTLKLGEGEWFLEELHLRDDYVCHLASKTKSRVEIRWITDEELTRVIAAAN
jgi:4'-phosphopantetheinyl transferase